MSLVTQYDAAIVGAGPNGLAAAITLARAGRSVVVYEAAETIGGGCRSGELTLPGFVHDICAAIHPLGVASRFMRSVPLADYGVEWITSDAALAHPLPDGGAAVLERSLALTGASFDDAHDAVAYANLMGPLVDQWQRLVDGVEAPLRPIYQMTHPATSLAMARFGLSALGAARRLAEHRFRGERARALFAGMSAHAVIPLERPPSAAAGLLLAVLGHAVGWPFPRGGSQHIVDALAAYLRSLGGTIVTGMPIASLAELPPTRMILCDITPRQLMQIARGRLPAVYVERLRRYRYGPGVFKLDLALDGPIPWANPACSRAATVHLGGTLSEIAASERDAWNGVGSQNPYVLLAQQSLFDSTRAPAGKHTVWAYCHVPNGYTGDMTTTIEAQIERFAPGFRDRIIGRHTMGPAAVERYNANYIGGDINGGVQDLGQLFTRPIIQRDPYATPVPGLFLCSSSTPPGGGVHGMCGYFAALSALRADERGKRKA